jgi:hypothetical protein
VKTFGVIINSARETLDKFISDQHRRETEAPRYIEIEIFKNQIPVAS